MAQNQRSRSTKRNTRNASKPIRPAVTPEVDILEAPIDNLPIKRTESGKFLPGHSLGGRPAIARDFRQRCREFMETDGWSILLTMSQTEKDRHRFQALELVTSYAYGKPSQPISNDIDNPIRPIILVWAGSEKARMLAEESELSALPEPIASTEGRFEELDATT